MSYDLSEDTAQKLLKGIKIRPQPQIMVDVQMEPFIGLPKPK
jgi:hypothetical protein